LYLIFVVEDTTLLELKLFEGNNIAQQWFIIKVFENFANFVFKIGLVSTEKNYKYLFPQSCVISFLIWFDDPIF